MAYATAGEYANAFNVAEAIGNEAGEADFSAAFSILCAGRDELREKAAKRPIDQEVAAAWALQRDAERLLSTLEGLDSQLLDMSGLEDQFDRLVTRLAAEGFDLGDVTLKVVPDFPGPYAGSAGWAMNLDVSDRRAYGVDVGVYVCEDLMMPLYTPFLIAHELVHAICGQKDSDFLARGLEDGLGDAFGSLYLARTLLDPHCCERMLLNSRIIFPQNQFWSIYSDGLQQALLVHELLGIDGLIDTLREANREGRGVIKSLEERLLTGDFDLLRRPRSETDAELMDFTHRYRAAARNLVVSPLAFFLAHEVRQGASCSRLLKQLEVSEPEGRKALEELQDRVFLVFVDKDEIWADETKVNLATGSLRYEIDSSSPSSWCRPM
ncbi:MAG TPA: hypothetical protein VFW48_10575 [Solirubrobacterales bacterium]|nr:hypothetical protein [Solirubrobacterales bacterium]